MYTLTKTFRFEAAHHLPDHDGKCARVHGHSFVGHVVCAGEMLQMAGPKRGMLLDFGTISAALKHLVENHLDHYDLNETIAQPGSPFSPPTSENIARWVYAGLDQNFLLRPFLKAVVIEETCTARCEYRP